MLLVEVVDDWEQVRYLAFVPDDGNSVWCSVVPQLTRVDEDGEPGRKRLAILLSFVLVRKVRKMGYTVPARSI